MLFRNKFLYTGCTFSLALCQKYAMGGYFGGVEAEPPAAIGSGEEALSRRRLEAKLPAFGNFAIFFCKNNLILGLF